MSDILSETGDCSVADDLYYPISLRYETPIPPDKKFKALGDLNSY